MAKKQDSDRLTVSHCAAESRNRRRRARLSTVDCRVTSCVANGVLERRITLQRSVLAVALPLQRPVSDSAPPWSTIPLYTFPFAYCTGPRCLAQVIRHCVSDSPHVTLRFRHPNSPSLACGDGRRAGIHFLVPARCCGTTTDAADPCGLALKKALNERSRGRAEGCDAPGSEVADDPHCVSRISDL